MSERNFDFPHDLFLDRRSSFPEMSQQILPVHAEEVRSDSEEPDNYLPQAYQREEMTPNDGAEQFPVSKRG